MLLRDAITIPTEVRQGDLVFTLADAADHAAQTLDDYVVTPQLETAFLEATSLVRAAVQEHSSKAAFLSGSFGAGKSNFMGVLQLLLNGQPAALAKPELASVVKQLSDWRGDRKFLTVPFQLIGAASLESALFGGYVTYVRERHPDAPLPEVYADEPILDNADELLAKLGDEAFFKVLNEGADDGWGDLGGWDRARYDAARNEPRGNTERQQLVQDLLRTLLTSFAEGAKANRGGYVDIESGLAALSRHAAELGYAGLILFLDELILWLMTRMADAAFVSEQAGMISKLVEASEADRPVPIISIVARQRDLRDLIGSDVPGAERLGFIDSLNFQAGRFNNIALDDTNLAAVAHHRLLRPKDEAGANALAAAFKALDLTEDQRDALRGAAGSDEAFALTYPFSPAFLQIVVDVAGALQRTRTGLRVLLDLLVQRRDTLEIGQLVPVGDLFDVLAAAEDPLTDDMKPRFDAAKRIYRNDLRPVLLQEHNLTNDSEPTSAFITDDRLLKTLLLAALVPNSEPFRNLTARRLVALNHGLITSPVPGTEVMTAIGKLNNWAGRIGALQLGDDPQNPTVHLVLSDIDTRAILDAVIGIDNTGSRRKLIRELLAEELNVPTDQLLQQTKVLWKGVWRTVDIVFGNVRDEKEVSEAAFKPDGSNWKVVIDFPFDDDGTPLDDLRRIEALRNAGHGWRTVCWIPSFFTADLRAQLGDLVRLNHLLPVPGQMGDRLREATKNLRPEDREAVRPQLEAQQRAARSRVQQALRQAYAVLQADPATIDSSHGLADHFPTLIDGFTIRPPVAATIREAFDNVVAQGLAHSYPAAPPIEVEVRLPDLRTVLQRCLDALDYADKRIPQVQATERKVMAAIANPLRLGVQSEQAFLLDVSPHWDQHFTKKLAERVQQGASGDPTVGELRAWIDEPQAMGLSRELQSLVILAWVHATDRTFTQHGGPAGQATIDHLPDDYQVRAEDLPGAATWLEAKARAEHILGFAGLPDVPSAVGLEKLGNTLAQAVHEYRADADALVTGLERVAALVGGEEPNRLRTAKVAAALLHDVEGTDSKLGRVEAFVAADVTPSPQAVGASIKAAAAVHGTIEGIDLDILGAGIAKDADGAIAAELTSLLAAEELAQPLAAPLRALFATARDLVLGATPPEPTPPPPASPRAKTLVAEHGLDRAAATARLDTLQAQLATDEYANATVDIEITVTLPDEA